MRKFSFLIILLLSIAAFSQKQLPTDVHRYVKQDTTQVLSEAQVKSLAATISLKVYKGLSVIDKAAVDKLLKEANPEAGGLEAALRLSTTGNVLTAENRSSVLSLILSAAAVQAQSSNSLVVNNFGGLLHTHDSLKSALKVLLYAKKLNNHSPILFTNLANVLFDLYDDRNAEIFYKRALRIDEHFAQAREGLILCYLKRKDLQSAYEELLRGVTDVQFSPVSKKMLDVVKYSSEKDKRKKDPAPPPPLPKLITPWDEEKTPIPVDQLQLPDFPDWPTRESFIAAGNSLSNWNKELNAKNAEVAEEYMAISQREIKKINEVMKLPRDQQQKELNKITHNYRMQKLIYALELLEFYFDDQIEKVWYQSTEQQKAISENFKKKFEIWAAGYVEEEKVKAKEMVNDIGGFESWAISKCNEKQQLVSTYYNDWRKVAKENHNKTTDLLRQYWIYVEPYLNQVYDLNMYDELDARRRMYVYNKMSVFSNSYPIVSFSMNVMGMDLAGGLNATCAKKKDKPEAEKEAAGAAGDLTTKVPKGTAPDCPFKDGNKLKVGIGPASIALDCSSIECEVLEGLGGSLNYNFKQHETTVFVGAGLKGEFGVPGVEAEASIKAGAFVKFNSSGEILDLGATSEAGVGGTFNHKGLGVTAGVTSGFLSGVNTQVGAEVTYKIF